MLWIVTVAVLLTTGNALRVVGNFRSTAAKTPVLHAVGAWELTVAAYLTVAGHSPAVMIVANGAVGAALLVAAVIERRAHHA